MVASKRLPASFDVPESMALPLYQRRAVAEIPLVVAAHETRTDTRIESEAPDGAGVAADSVSAALSKTAFLNVAPPALTLATWPVPTVLALTSTSASRSYVSLRTDPFS